MTPDTSAKSGHRLLLGGVGVVVLLILTFAGIGLPRRHHRLRSKGIVTKIKRPSETRAVFI